MWSSLTANWCCKPELCRWSHLLSLHMLQTPR
jgi:hypothetical protein